MLDTFEIIKVKNNKVNSVSFALVIPYGAKDEPPAKIGITHLVEHMCFRRSDRLSQTQLYDALESLGVFIRGTTGKNYLKFSFTCRKKVFSQVIKIFSEMLFFTSYTSEDIEKEKKIVFSEINERYCSTFESIPEGLWDNPSFSNPILGTKETVASITTDELVKYKRALIKCGGLIIISGNFSQEDFQRTVDIFKNRNITVIDSDLSEDIFTVSLQNRKNDVNLIKEELASYDRSSYSRNSELIRSVTKPDERFTFVKTCDEICEVIYSMHTKLEHKIVKSKIMLQMLESILFQGYTSCVGEVLREEYGLVYGVESYVEIIENEICLVFMVKAPADEIENVITMIDTILQSPDIRQRHLRYIKAFYCDNSEMIYDNPEHVCTHIASNYINLQQAITPNEYAKIIEGFSCDEYRELFSAFYSRRNIFIAGKVKRKIINNIKRSLSF